VDLVQERHIVILPDIPKVHGLQQKVLLGRRGIYTATKEAAPIQSLRALRNLSAVLHQEYIQAWSPDKCLGGPPA
jgi:hypothetical protein